MGTALPFALCPARALAPLRSAPLRSGVLLKCYNMRTRYGHTLQCVLILHWCLLEEPPSALLLVPQQRICFLLASRHAACGIVRPGLLIT